MIFIDAKRVKWIIQPEITVPEGIAFFISILHKNNDYMNVLCNSLVKLGANVDGMLVLTPRIDFDSCFYAETIEIDNAWDLLSRNDPFHYFARLTADRVSCGYCATGFFDGFFIPGTPSYHNDHTARQFYIIEYNDNKESFITVGTGKEGEACLYEFPVDDFYNGIESFATSKNEDKFFTSFIKCRDELPEIDLDTLISSIEDLISSGFDEERALLDSGTLLSARNTRMICEHAKLMKKRMDYIRDCYPERNLNTSSLENVCYAADRIMSLESKSNRLNLISLMDNEKEAMRSILLELKEKRKNGSDRSNC